MRGVGGKLWLRELCVSDIFLIKSKRCQFPRATAAQAKREDPDLQEKKKRDEEGKDTYC